MEMAAGKYEDDAQLWNCWAYSKYPNAFFFQAPIDCGNIYYKKFEEFYFETNSRKEQQLQVIPLLQNGDWFLNDKKLSGYEMFCDAYTRANLTKNNTEYQRERDYFCAKSTKIPAPITQNTSSSATLTSRTSTSNNIDLSTAATDAMLAVALRTSLMVGIFLVLTIGVSIKNLSKASHCGRWWGALLASIIAVLLMFSNTQPTYSEAWFQIITINFLLFYALGFSIAYTWQKLRNRPPAKTTKTEDDALWALALAETEGTNRQDGLWAKCLVESNGITDVARAAYIKQRVKQLQNKT